MYIYKRMYIYIYIHISTLILGWVDTKKLPTLWAHVYPMCRYTHFQICSDRLFETCNDSSIGCGFPPISHCVSGLGVLQVFTPSFSEPRTSNLDEHPLKVSCINVLRSFLISVYWVPKMRTALDHLFQKIGCVSKHMKLSM